MTYKTLVKDKAWILENFLSESDLSYLYDQYVNKDFDMLHVNNQDFKPLMANTGMSYRVITMDIYKPIYNALSTISTNEFGKNLDCTKTSGLNMQYKRFEPSDYYDLHAEDSKKYGDMVYIMYLTDEKDGELIIPSLEDAKKEWSDGFQQMTQQFDIGFANQTVSVTPRKNTCVVMRTGIAHIVRSCSGRRDSIAGWPWFIKK